MFLSTSIIRNYLSLPYYCLFRLRYFVGVCIPYNFRAGNFPLSCFKWLPNYVSWAMKLMNSVGKNCAFFVQLLMWVPQTSMIQFIQNKSWVIYIVSLALFLDYLRWSGFYYQWVHTGGLVAKLCLTLAIPWTVAS